jgi:hypothetical protein
VEEKVYNNIMDCVCCCINGINGNGYRKRKTKALPQYYYYNERTTLLHTKTTIIRIAYKVWHGNWRFYIQSQFIKSRNST